MPASIYFTFTAIPRTACTCLHQPHSKRLLSKFVTGEKILSSSPSQRDKAERWGRLQREWRRNPQYSLLGIFLWDGSVEKKVCQNWNVLKNDVSLEQRCQTCGSSPQNCSIWSAGSLMDSWKLGVRLMGHDLPKSLRSLGPDEHGCQWQGAGEGCADTVLPHLGTNWSLPLSLDPITAAHHPWTLPPARIWTPHCHQQTIHSCHWPCRSGLGDASTVWTWPSVCLTPLV